MRPFLFAVTVSCLAALGVGSPFAKPSTASALCKFEAHVFSSFDAMNKTAEVLEVDDVEVLELRFIDIDLAAGRARLVGNIGVSDVSVLISDAGTLSFLETTPSGNLNVTTIYTLVDGSRGQNIASHSRHIESAPALVMFSQWVGRCLLTQD